MFQKIGWRGIELLIPEEWEFKSESRRLSQGDIVFSSTNIKFELKWKNKKNPIMLEEFVKNLEAKMKKSYEELRSTIR